MQIESQTSSSIFYNTVLPKTGILGHSMGGGASFLAAENNPNVNTLINFAAAETNPSAISAARNITIPTVIFSEMMIVLLHQLTIRILCLIV